MRVDQRGIVVRLLAGAVAFWAFMPPAQSLTPGNADRIGHWGPTFEEAACPAGDAGACPPVPQALAMLKNGRVFYFQGMEDGRRTLEGGPEGSSRFLELGAGAPRWSVPDTAGQAALPCADIAQLADGRLMVASGSSAYLGVSTDGTPSSSSSWILDPASFSLQPAAHLRGDRRHFSLVTLADGSLLAAGGSTTTTRTGRAVPAARTETFHPEAGSWTENYTGPASETALPALPQLFVMPNGRVFYGGAGHADTPESEPAAALTGIQQFFDPATSTWQVVGPSPLGARQDATSVMLPLGPPYHKATVLTFGGNSGTGSSLAAVSTLTTVDRAGTVQNSLTGRMHRGRSSADAVPLPDGTVLALGGTGVGAGPEEAGAELFVPGAPAETSSSAPGRWYKMATPNLNRTHHHSAVLLPDGRVLLGGNWPHGHGLPGVDRPDASFEIFTPHYLYRSRMRPTIRSAPEAIAWGERFEVGTAQPLNINSIVLMRLASPQHGTDSDVRTLWLDFTRASGRLEVTAPPDGSVAPPGYYYLFVNKETSRGIVPSVARIVRVGIPRYEPVVHTRPGSRAASSSQAKVPRTLRTLTPAAPLAPLTKGLGTEAEPAALRRFSLQTPADSPMGGSSMEFGDPARERAT